MFARLTHQEERPVYFEENCDPRQNPRRLERPTLRPINWYALSRGATGFVTSENSGSKDCAVSCAGRLTPPFTKQVFFSVTPTRGLLDRPSCPNVPIVFLPWRKPSAVGVFFEGSRGFTESAPAVERETERSASRIVPSIQPKEGQGGDKETEKISGHSTGEAPVEKEERGEGGNPTPRLGIDTNPYCHLLRNFREHTTTLPRLTHITT